MRNIALGAVLYFILTFTGLAYAAPITGSVRVTGRTPGSNVPTIVYAEPLDGKPAIAAGRYTMSQRKKSFTPRVLAVPVGSTMIFPNDDPIFHNVFSLSRPEPFDLGLYREGSTKTKTFTKQSIYRVFCNIHPQMTGVILVLPTPYITETDGASGYRLDLPAGRYRITAWSERSQPSSVEIEVGAAPDVAPDLALDESRFVETGHKNKFGQDYPKSAYDPTR